MLFAIDVPSSYLKYVIFHLIVQKKERYPTQTKTKQTAKRKGISATKSHYRKHKKRVHTYIHNYILYIYIYI